MRGRARLEGAVFEGARDFPDRRVLGALVCGRAPERHPPVSSEDAGTVDGVGWGSDQLRTLARRERACSRRGREGWRLGGSPGEATRLTVGGLWDLLQKHLLRGLKALSCLFSSPLGGQTRPVLVHFFQRVPSKPWFGDRVLMLKKV